MQVEFVLGYPSSVFSNSSQYGQIGKSTFPQGKALVR